MFRQIRVLVSSFSFILLICLVLLLMGGKLFQQTLPVSFYNVLTSSMSPKIPAGSLVIVREVNPNLLEKGDVITFTKNNETVTHRVSAIEDERFVTKGDRNQLVDYLPVEAEEINGKVIFSLPYLGRFGEIIQTPRGMLALILTILQLLLLLEMITLIRELLAERQENLVSETTIEDVGQRRS